VLYSNFILLEDIFADFADSDSFILGLSHNASRIITLSSGCIDRKGPRCN